MSDKEWICECEECKSMELPPEGVSFVALESYNKLENSLAIANQQLQLAALLNNDLQKKVDKQYEELNNKQKLIDRAMSILSSFNEYREATVRGETSKSPVFHTYELILYDLAKDIVKKLEE